MGYKTGIIEKFIEVSKHQLDYVVESIKII